jgi:hypothetical protein
MARQARTLIIAFVLVVAAALGAGVVGSHTALAADPQLTISIGGDNTVYSWEDQLYHVVIENRTTVNAYDLFIELYDYTLPLDYRQISAYVDRGCRSFSGCVHLDATCRITDGAGWSGKTRATCTVQSLKPGDFLHINMNTGTTLVWGSGVGAFTVKAYVNYPTDTHADGSSSRNIAWNP